MLKLSLEKAQRTSLTRRAFRRHRDWLWRDHLNSDEEQPEAWSLVGLFSVPMAAARVKRELARKLFLANAGRSKVVSNTFQDQFFPGAGRID